MAPHKCFSSTGLQHDEGHYIVKDIIKKKKRLYHHDTVSPQQGLIYCLTQSQLHEQFLLVSEWEVFVLLLNNKFAFALGHCKSCKWPCFPL